MKPRKAISIQILPEWNDFTHTEVADLLGVSRQAVLYARRRASGLCVRCGAKAETHRPFCSKHNKANTAYHRKRRGFKPWKPGGVGRPPTGSKARKVVSQ